MAAQDFKGTVNGLTPIEETAWTDGFGVLGIAGWAAGATGNILYKKIGSLVFVKFFITGTSNDTVAVINLPFTGTADFDQYILAGLCKDNGTDLTAPSLMRIPGSVTQVLLYKNFAFDAWTASGVKEIRGQFFYEAA